MYKVKNLTNSPHRITTADGGFGVLPARGEEDFDIHPRMVQPYSGLGYLKITKLGDEKPKAKAVKVADPEPEKFEVNDKPNEQDQPTDSNKEVTESTEEISEDEQKESLIAQLKELNIKADKRSSVEKLQEKLDEALAK